MTFRTKKTLRKWTGLLLAACVLMTAMPLAVFAEEDGEEVPHVEIVLNDGKAHNEYDGDHDPVGDVSYVDIDAPCAEATVPPENRGGSAKVKTGDVVKDENADKSGVRVHLM